MALSNGLTNLLATAISLVHAPGSTTSEVVRIGDARFRVITQRHEGDGWIVVLLQEPREDFVCDEVLERWYKLTPREIEVARLLADRYSNKEIAERLGITVYTAGRHTERVLKKLGLQSRRHVRVKLLES